MILASENLIEEVRKRVLKWSHENGYPGYNHVLPIMEWHLNAGGFTMHKEKVTCN